MKNTWLFFFLFTQLALHGQDNQQTVRATESYVRIDGTNIKLIPPLGFEESPNFKGFQNPDDPTSMIIVVEIPGPYSEISKGFNAEMMATRGMTLINSDSFPINQQQGLFITVDQPSQGLDFRKYILAYGDQSSSVVINGVFIKDSLELGQQIKRSIESIQIDTDIAIDPRADVPFNVDESLGNLKFATVMGNSLLFTRDGIIPQTDSVEKVLLIVDHSYAKLDITDPEAFCIKRLKLYPEPYTLLENTSPEPIQIAGLDGYQLTGVREDSLEKEWIYQVALFEPDGGYILMAGIVENFSALADTEAVIQSFYFR